MKTINQMPFNEVIQLYYEKHFAMREGDMAALLEIKKKCPELFDKEQDTMIRDMIIYAKEFQASDHYKNLKRKELKKSLSIIKNDQNPE